MSRWCPRSSSNWKKSREKSREPEKLLTFLTWVRDQPKEKEVIKPIDKPAEIGSLHKDMRLRNKQCEGTRKKKGRGTAVGILSFHPTHTAIYIFTFVESQRRDVIVKACEAVGSVSDSCFDIRFNPDVCSPGIEHTSAHTHTHRKDLTVVLCCRRPFPL